MPGIRHSPFAIRTSYLILHPPQTLLRSGYAGLGSFQWTPSGLKVNEKQSQAGYD
jgi:hypothetical protein